MSNTKSEEGCKTFQRIIKQISTLQNVAVNHTKAFKIVSTHLHHKKQSSSEPMTYINNKGPNPERANK